MRITQLTTTLLSCALLGACSGAPGAALSGPSMLSPNGSGVSVTLSQRVQPDIAVFPTANTCPSDAPVFTVAGNLAGHLDVQLAARYAQADYLRFEIQAFTVTNTWADLAPQIVGERGETYFEFPVKVGNRYRIRAATFTCGQLRNYSAWQVVGVEPPRLPAEPAPSKADY